MTSVPFDIPLRVKFPSRSVMVPLEVPFSMTLAPITGSPLSVMTCPFSVAACMVICTSFTFAKIDDGEAVQRAEIIIIEKNLFFDKFFN